MPTDGARALGPCLVVNGLGLPSLEAMRMSDEVAPSQRSREPRPHHGSAADRFNPVAAISRAVLGAGDRSARRDDGIALSRRDRRLSLGGSASRGGATAARSRGLSLLAFAEAHSIGRLWFLDAIGRIKHGRGALRSLTRAKAHWALVRPIVRHSRTRGSTRVHVTAAESQV